MNKTGLVNQDGQAVQSKESFIEEVKKQNAYFGNCIKDLHKPTMQLMVGFGPANYDKSTAYMAGREIYVSIATLRNVLSFRGEEGLFDVEKNLPKENKFSAPYDWFHDKKKDPKDLLIEARGLLRDQIMKLGATRPITGNPQEAFMMSTALTRLQTAVTMIDFQLQDYL